jgi:hypothetical protein
MELLGRERSRRETKIGGESRDEAQQMARVFLLGSLQSRVPLLSHLSFPKIRSGRIRAVRQNQIII